MAGTDKADKHYANSTARIADQGNVPAGWICEDNDTGTKYQRTTSGWNQISASGAAHVTTMPGGATHVREQQNLDATAVTFDFSTTPIRACRIVAINDGTTSEEYNSAVICIDPPNSAVRDAWFAETGSVSNSQRIPIMANGIPVDFVFTSEVSYIGAKHELGTENEIRLFVIGVEA